MAITDSVGALAVEAWKRVYAQYPKITVFSTVLGAVFGLLAVVITEVEHRGEEAKRASSLASYSRQLAALDQTQANLRQLISFVEQQKAQVADTQRALAAIKTEREQLFPLLSADRRTVDALFVRQEQRNRTAQVRERWLGFGIGVGASLLASIIWYSIASTLRRRRGNATTA